MKNIITKFQKIMMAATFAEAGEWNTAREMIPDAELSRQPLWISKIFMAVTFAESGLHDEALRLLEPARTDNRNFNSTIMEELGLKGVRLIYGTVSIY
jgi:hypothetical protein